MARTQVTLTLATLFASVLFFSLISCEKKAQSVPAAVAAQSAKYTIRGQVHSLPDPARKGLEELQVQHERIPDYKDKSGKVVGMNSMVMGFPPGEGVKVPDLKVGDKVEVDFEVVWTGKVPYFFTAIRKLPPDTVLDFSK